MNREIKFRGWVETDDGEETIYFDKLECDNGLWFNYTEKHINNHISLMRFSGLNDKNIKDIYEGDILDNKEVVTFRDGCFFAGSTPLALSAAHREIIGNIFENPELLQP